MSDVVIGMDIGGTKAEVVTESVDGLRLSVRRVSATDWSANPVDAAAAWIGALVESSRPEGARVVGVGVGAQGCDTNTHSQALQLALDERGYPASVVNDAALLVPAAGVADGIGVIAGTGAIAVGRDKVGDYQFAGGWGWALGDDAGAVGIVREATRSVLFAHDSGEADDWLLRALLDAFAVPDIQALTRAVNDEPTVENWAPRAPAVFAAADRGSELAIAVIERAAGHLVELVSQLLTRGCVGEVVVEAGTVIVRQPRLRASFEELLRKEHPNLQPQSLEAPPVVGAVALARSRAGIA